MRSLHFYASAFVAVMVLFYAATGFLATHADWLIGEEQMLVEQDLRTVPADVIADEAARERWCRELLGSDARVERGEQNGAEQWYLVRSEQRALQCIVNEQTAQARIIPLQILLETAPTDHGQLAEYIATELGGNVNAESRYHDDAYKTLHFSVESVWFEAHVSVFLDKQLYSIERHDMPFIRSLVELHRGQHSSMLQTLLADLTALALIVVVMSGVMMGMQMNKRRRLTVAALVISLFLTILLIIAR